VTSNNVSTVTTALNSEADLEISKIDSPDPATAGETLTYTLSVTNKGPSDASGVVISDTLPGGVTFAEAGACINAGSAVTCTVGSLSAGSSVSRTIVVTVDASTTGSLLNIAGVKADTSLINTSDDVIVETTTVNVLTDLAITKMVNPTQAQPGQLITYTLSFGNLGPSTATGVVITDIIPVCVTVQSVINSGVAITDTGTSPAYVWNVQNLSGGTGGIITITGVLSEPLAAGVFSNTATISGVGDTTLANNSASAMVTVSSPPTWSVYLPVIFKDFAYLPDLVIDDFVVNSNQVTITIRNVGVVAVTDDFWVQISINPATPPTDVNQQWNGLGNSQGGETQGAFWGVVSPGVPVARDATLTLNLNDIYYYTGAPANNVPSPIPAGATVYAQIDAINFSTTYGNVLEIDESNNITSTISIE